jgi:dynein heavy chain
MNTIFSTILTAFYASFTDQVQNCVPILV